MPLPETFRAAIEKGVRNIKGKLDKLNPDEKRQLLADLRERGDCPEGWKNKKNMTPKKQQYILNILHSAIYRLLNPEKARAISVTNNKRRRENGKSEEYYADPINKDKANARFRERYATDLKFRTMCILRARLYAALKNN